MKPKRIQRKRTKGFRLPEGCVYVGRPTKWGNPVRVGQIFTDGEILTQADAVAYYRKHITIIAPITDELRGKDLACWCPLDDKDGNKVPCHADILLELANRPRAEQEQPTCR